METPTATTNSYFSVRFLRVLRVLAVQLPLCSAFLFVPFCGYAFVFFTLMISAAMEMAISSGVWEAMGIPIGA